MVVVIVIQEWRGDSVGGSMRGMKLHAGKVPARQSGILLGKKGASSVSTGERVRTHVSHCVLLSGILAWGNDWGSISAPFLPHIRGLSKATQALS